MNMGFSHDWNARVRPGWEALFPTLNWMGKPDLKFLEIGCFEGRATMWFLDNVLTDSSSSIHVIDTFEGNPEFAQHGVDSRQMLERFQENIERYKEKVTVHVGRSFDKLCQFNLAGIEYDLIYVDGSHRAIDSLSDAVLSWPLVKPGGLLLFDDMTWKFTLTSGETLNPGQGAQAFLGVIQGGTFEVVTEACDQIGIRKL